MAEPEQTIDQRIVKALGHPLRARLLTLLNEREASPSQLAEQLEEPLGNVSYHVRILVELECIELVRTTPRRGAIEHHYRAVVPPYFSDADWQALPESARGSLVGPVLASIWGDVGAAAARGAFNRDDVAVIRYTVELDARGWTDLSQALVALYARSERIAAASAKRIAKGQGEARPAVFVTMLFDRPPAKERAEAEG